MKMIKVQKVYDLVMADSIQALILSHGIKSTLKIEESIRQSNRFYSEKSEIDILVRPDDVEKTKTILRDNFIA